MFLLNQIAGFFGHQYLWKDIINVLDFSNRDRFAKEIYKSTTIYWVGQVYPATPAPVKTCQVVTWWLDDSGGWSGGCMATLEIVQNEKLTHSFPIHPFSTPGGEGGGG